MTTIGKRIRELRKQHRLSLDGVALKFHVDKSTWSRIENGHREPSIQLVSQICMTWNVSADYLLFGEKDSGTQLNLDGLSFYQISAIKEIVKGLRHS